MDDKGVEKEGSAMKLYTAFDIANYFLLKAQDDEDQELLSNLKLQKLVYYAQGIHLAEFGTPLFEEKIIAWQYGPVIPILYQEYKKYGAGRIPADTGFDPMSIDDNTRAYLYGMYDFFGQYSAVRLMQLAHADQCYIEAGINNEITPEAMQKDLRNWLQDG